MLRVTKWTVLVTVMVQVCAQDDSLIPSQHVQDVNTERETNLNKADSGGTLNTVPFTSDQDNNPDYDDGGRAEGEGDETRDNHNRKATSNNNEPGGSGVNRQYTRPQQGGTRRQHGGGGGGGGRTRQYIPRQYGERRTGGGRGSRQFEVVQAPGIDVNEVGGAPGSELTPQQMDSIILLLQRLSDRLVGMETLQRQQTERIDTINYRLTRIELQAEERKGAVSEINNALRHRMETTENALDRVSTHLDEITTGITSLTQRQTELQNTVNEIPKGQDEGGAESNRRKLQAVMATVHGVRAATQAVKEDVLQLAQNLTILTNISENLDTMSDKMVTKQYLHENLNELNAPDTSLTMLARTMLVQPRPGRRGASGARQQEREAEDCWEVQRRGNDQSGVYTIQPRYSPTPFFVYCDMETDGGGWTVIQRREDGTVDFLRDWHDYKYGFGNLAGEFWLGNDKIHMLTMQHVCQLRVDLADFDQQTGHALYSAFAMGSELERYSLKMLGEYIGDIGDSLRYHVGQSFSTKDIDNDAWPDRNCARDHQGAWWYRACETSNLNGRYLRGPLPVDRQYTGLYWYDFRGHQYSLWHSKMMIRRGGSVGKPVFKDITELEPNTPTQRPGEVSTMTPVPDDRNVNPEHDPYADYHYDDTFY